MHAFGVPPHSCVKKTLKWQLVEQSINAVSVETYWPFQDQPTLYEKVKVAFIGGVCSMNAFIESECCYEELTPSRETMVVMVAQQPKTP